MPVVAFLVFGTQKVSDNADQIDLFNNDSLRISSSLGRVGNRDDLLESKE